MLWPMKIVLLHLDKKYAVKGYPVIAIMPNNPDVKPGDNMEAMKARAKAKGFTFPYLMDDRPKDLSTVWRHKNTSCLFVTKTNKGNDSKVYWCH